MMKDWWKLAFGVLSGLLAAGVILLIAAPPRGTPIALQPPPEPPPLVVHVSGGVVQPGVYTLPAGSRLQQAVEAAGGLLPQADTQNINLAAPLQDGQKVAIPTLAPTATPFSRGPGATDILLPSPVPTSGLVNINTASQAELESLPGIGPVTAQKIIQYRQEHGPFQSIEDIMNVPGIGQKTFEAIKDLITV